MRTSGAVREKRTVFFGAEALGRFRQPLLGMERVEEPAIFGVDGEEFERRKELVEAVERAEWNRWMSERGYEETIG